MCIFVSEEDVDEVHEENEGEDCGVCLCVKGDEHGCDSFSEYEVELCRFVA